MKIIVNIILMSVVCLGQYGAEMLLNLEISEICCHGCVEKMKQLKLDGVKSLKALEEIGSIEIVVSSDKSLAEVLKSLREAGYTMEHGRALIRGGHFKRDLGQSYIIAGKDKLCSKGYSLRNFRKGQDIEGEIILDDSNTPCIHRISQD